jgi:predicted transcriptional regulator YdeE/DNA-binding transcriptional MerR regulator
MGVLFGQKTERRMESTMLKIGDFSKLAQVSVKALRYYGELGLLRPAWIDRFTGYRYYSIDQLSRLNRILALKDLGFSLEQIQRLLQDDLSAAELRGMMRIKHAELERQIEAEQARLARVEARLQQIEQEGALPDYEVVLKGVPAQRVVGIREVVPGYHDVMPLFRELRALLRAQNVVPHATRPCLAIYYDAEYRDQGVDAEAAAPLSSSLRGTPRTVIHELPGAETMACVIHQGGYEGLPRAYETLITWIEANGYRVTGPNRDVYLKGAEAGPGTVTGLAPAGEFSSARDAGPAGDVSPAQPAEYITEVQFPVERMPISNFVIQFKEKGEMEPKIVTKPAFTVVGMLYHGRNENNEIAQMWGEFVPRMGEIKHATGAHETFGVCRDLEPEGLFEYVAGLPVTQAEDVPQGMVSWEVPEQKYAVFPCTLPTIGEAYAYANKTWLPGSGYERGDGPDFEHYDESFNPDEDGSHFHIYVPIK